MQNESCTILSKDINMTDDEYNNFIEEKFAKSLNEAVSMPVITRIPPDKAGVIRISARQKLFLDVLRKKAGNVSATCNTVGVRRETYNKWYIGNVKFRHRVDEILEELVDVAETKLYQKVLDGDFNAISMFLKAKGKDRGYGENSNNQSNVLNININFVSDETQSDNSINDNNIIDIN